MKHKEFKLKDVLATYTGIILSDGGIDGVYKVLNYLTGENLFTHQLPRTANNMKAILREQVEFLNSPCFDCDVDRLKLLLETESGKKEPGYLCKGWLSEQIAKHGASVLLSPSPEEYKAQNPISELANMMEGKRNLTGGEDVKSDKTKNGAEEAEGLVNVTFMILKDLSTKQPIVLYELVEKCKNRNHKFFGNTGETLRKMELVQSDYSIHSSIKHIVLSSVKGVGMEIKLCSPVVINHENEGDK